MGENDAHPLTDEQIDALVDEIQDRLGDSTARTYGRRGVLAALGVAALGTGSASAQASGTVGTASNPVDVEGYDISASNSFTDPAGVTHSGELADLSDVGASGQWQEVNSGSNIEPIDGETVGTGVEDVDVGTLSTNSLAHIPNQGTAQSLFSSLSQGFCVGHSPNAAMKSVDPTNFADDSAAVQAVNDWITTNGTVGDIYLPALRPDGTEWSFPSQVVLGDTSAQKAVSIHGIGFSDRNGPTIGTSINDGSAVFVQTGDSTNSLASYGTVFEGISADLNGNDTGLVKCQYLVGFSVQTPRTQGYAGSAIQIGTKCFGFNIGGEFSFLAAGFDGSVSVEFVAGSPGNGVISEGMVVDGGNDAVIRDSTGVVGLRIAGHFEAGNAGTNATAIIDLQSQGVVSITDATKIGGTANGADGILVNDGGARVVIAPSQVASTSGDGIRVANANRFDIATDIEFQNIGGDSINVADVGIGPNTIPREQNVDGSINYPSGAWGVLYYPDGWQLFTEGTATISPSSTNQVANFAGNAGDEKSMMIWIENDPAADVDIEKGRGWNTGTSQEELRVSETSGNGSVDVGYRIEKR